jgi:beta-glucanase (GH16 family)
MRTPRPVFAAVAFIVAVVLAVAGESAGSAAAGSPPGNGRGHKPSPTPTTSSSTTTKTTSPTPTPTATSTSPSPTPTTSSPSPTPTSTVPSGPTCGGEVVYKADGSAWTCTFDDEFDGTSLNTGNWTPVTTASNGYHSGQECFVNSPNNVSVANGYLSLTVRQEAAPFVCVDPKGNYTTQYTSGAVMSYGHFSQTYGRFEVRAAFPAATVAGLQSSLWLWPNSPLKYGAWPASGEIDIAEEYSLYPDRAIPYVHYVPATLDWSVTNNNCLLTNVAGFHDYAVEWTTNTITVSFDGTTCVSDNWNPASPLVKPQPFDMPFFINLTQALGIGSNLFDPAITPLPATTRVDYVRVWS